MKYCSFSVESNAHLMDLLIHGGFRDSDVLFQFHKMADGFVRCRYRISLSNEQEWELIRRFYEEHPDEEPMKYKELFACPLFAEILDAEIPVKELALDEAETETVCALYGEGFPEKYEIVWGCDGHSCVLTLYGAHSSRNLIWCCVEPKLEKIAVFVNSIVEKAGLDTERYGICVVRR